MESKRIAIIGAGELGQQIAHLGKKNNYNIVGFFDDYVKDSIIDGLCLLGSISDIDVKSEAFDELIIAIGYNHFETRKSLFDKLQKKYPFATIIDKSAIIDPTATVDAGSVIYPNVVIDKQVHVGKNVLLNLSCTICHNSDIGAHSYIAPAVTLAGYVSIGECVFLGVGTTIIDNMTIADNVLVGAQALVNKDIVDPGGTYMGVPIHKKL